MEKNTAKKKTPATCIVPLDLTAEKKKTPTVTANGVSIY